MLRQQSKCIMPVGRHDHCVPPASKHRLHDFSNRRAIINDKNAGVHGYYSLYNNRRSLRRSGKADAKPFNLAAITSYPFSVQSAMDSNKALRVACVMGQFDGASLSRSAVHGSSDSYEDRIGGCGLCGHRNQWLTVASHGIW